MTTDQEPRMRRRLAATLCAVIGSVALLAAGCEGIIQEGRASSYSIVTSCPDDSCTNLPGTLEPTGTPSSGGSSLGEEPGTESSGGGGTGGESSGGDSSGGSLPGGGETSAGGSSGGDGAGSPGGESGTPGGTLEFCTYTQGGWGTSCDGNNPGCLRDRAFAIAFPVGLVVGRGRTMTFTSSATVEAYLPAEGTPGVLEESLVDPRSSPAGVLGGQLTAVKLAVGIGDAGLMPSPTSVGNLRLNDGAFGGLTVRQLIDLADRAIGGETGALEGRSLSQLNDALTGVNQAFVDCRSVE